MNSELNILIIDDSEADSILVMREITRSLNAMHKRVSTRDELLAALERRHWDIVICDYIIPGFSAFSALQILKDAKQDIPFIVVSGKVDEEISIEVMKAGASDYILKDKLGRLVPVIKRELKEAENRLKGRNTADKLLESDERYRDICENTSDLIFIVRADGAFTYANPAFQRATGFSLDDLSVKKMPDIIKAGALDKWNESVHRVLRTAAPERIETVLRTRGKTELYIDGECSCRNDNNGKQFVRCLFRDITERKKTEEMWEKYKAIVNASSECMSMINDDYVYEAVNDAYCRAQGKPREEIIGKTVSEIWGRNVFNKSIKGIIDKCFQGAPVTYREWIEFPAQGRRYHEILLYPYRREGKIVNVVVITRDITELDKTEEKRRQNIESLSFLSKTAMGFIGLGTEKDIYKYIAERLQEVIPDSVVMTCSYDKQASAMRIKNIAGAGDNIPKIQSITGFDIMNVDYKVNDEAKELLCGGRLHKASGGLYELSYGKIPENICRLIERLYNISECYTMGFVKLGELYGNAKILSRREISQDKMAMIEAFVNQASVALLRRSAEEELKDSEEKMRVLFEHSPSAYCLIDENGLVREFNRAFKKLTGYNRDELIGKDAMQMILPGMPGEQPRDKAAAEGVLGDVKAIECILKRKNGQEIVTEISKHDVQIKNKRHQLVILEDIDERKRFVDEIRRLAKFVYENPEPMMRMTGDGKLVYANPSGMKILSDLKFEIDKAVPKHWREIIGEVMATGERRNIEIGLKGQTFSFEVVPITEAGYVNLYGSEITDKKVWERSIKESEERYKALFEESRDMVFISTPEGGFKDINRAGVNLLGFESKEEALGINIATGLYFNPQDRRKVLQRLEEYGFISDYEIKIKKKDGKPLTVLCTADLVRDPKNNKTEFRGIMRDITERRKLEAQLLQSAKMESLGMLAGGIAHDFNNLLTGIIGNVSFLKTRLSGQKEYLEDVIGIEESAKSAAGLTAQLLAFARGGKYNKEVTDINEVIGNTIKLVARTFESNIEVKTVLSECISAVEADPVQMGQVVMNLCVNARDAMPKGGVIKITTGMAEINENELKEIIDTDAKAGSYVYLSVHDNGMGMDKEMSQRVFEPFFTTKEMKGGTGLGLAVVYGIVKNHRGFVRVLSESGKGSEFRVYVPASSIVRKAAEVKPKEPLKGKGETVLVVDDEKEIRHLAKRILENNGYKVLTAENGEEALKVFKESSREISLVILDMIMPKTESSEVYGEMKRIKKGFKLLISTGYSKSEKTDKLIEMGAKGIIQKPYNVEQILLCVRNALDSKPII